MEVRLAVRPRAPLSLPHSAGGDRTLRRRGPWLERLLVLDSVPMLVRAREGGAEIIFEAESLDPLSIGGPGAEHLRQAELEDLEAGIGRMRFAFGVDDDLAPFAKAFRSDPLFGSELGSRLRNRPHRRPVAWEALLWAITEQLIEYRRAVGIQRQIIRRFGLRLADGSEGPTTVPSPTVIAAASPAELEACGLSARRSVATIKVAREVASGRVNPEDSAGDRRLLAIPEIGAWTIACLALRGRGEPDALLAGDLAQVKLVGYLNSLGRLAEVEEVEAFYAQYRPWRGLAGEYLARAHGAAITGPGNRVRINRRSLGRQAA